MASLYLCVCPCSIAVYKIKSALVLTLDILPSRCSMEVEISPFKMREYISS